MYDTRIENRENLKILINSFEFIFIINLSHVNTNQILIFSKLPSATLWEECHYFTFLQIFLIYDLTEDKGFPDGSDGKELACSEEDLTLIPRLGRSPGEWNGNPLQYSCLENLKIQDGFPPDMPNLKFQLPSRLRLPRLPNLEKTRQRRKPALEEGQAINAALHSERRSPALSRHLQPVSRFPWDWSVLDHRILPSPLWDSLLITPFYRWETEAERHTASDLQLRSERSRASIKAGSVASQIQRLNCTFYCL